MPTPARADGLVTADAAPRRVVVAVSNLKGGVAKTTTTVSLAALFAADRERVLVIDLDPQGSATQQLLGRTAEDLGEGLLEVMKGKRRLVDVAVRVNDSTSIWITPSDEKLGEAESACRMQVAGGQLNLKQALAAVADDWDVVLIDCPPENKHLVNCALVAADEVLVPCLLEPAATRQLARLTHRIADMRVLNPGLGLCGVLATRVMPRRGLTNEVWDELSSTYGTALFESFVRDDGKVAEADGHAKPVSTYAKSSNGAKDYRDVYKELRTRLTAHLSP